MNKSFEMAMDQAWSVYYVLKYQQTMSVLQAEQCHTQLTACVGYLADAKASTTDADLVETYDEAIVDTLKCAGGLQSLIAAAGCEHSAAAANTHFTHAQFGGLVSNLYWL